ncbi:MAG: hypothetical protein A3F76_00265 [Burkholderiales bacterium RIFCSPLOWO2_12_FULL_65_40]|nr:MAG: hypothetical protein A3F76_00265 [Burkholderiales bacterium RIFCSPLOWO2_12_FULL_65_40]
MTDRLQHPSHLPIAPFGDRDAVPAIGTFTPPILDGAKCGHAIIELNAFQQPSFLFIAERTQHTHGVLALQTKPGMHQLVGQFTGTGKQQQTFRIQVKTPHGLPFALLQARKLAENSGAILRIVVRHHFPHRFVVSNHAGGRWINAVTNWFAIDLDLIPELNSLTNVRRFIVDRYPPLQDQLLHFQT